MLEYAKLNGTWLKIFAALLMVVDHIGAVLFPENIMLRIIGRLSFPIFAFFVAEGIAHTKNRVKYMCRLLIAGVVSQPVFSLCVVGNVSIEKVNIMFTFFLAVLIVWIYEKLPENKKLYGFIVAAGIALLSDYFHFDYGDYGVVLVVLYYFLRDTRWVALTAGGIFQIAAGIGIQRYSAVSMIPLLLYNGKPGKNIKYFFYVFYPAHLLVLYLIKIYWC